MVARADLGAREAVRGERALTHRCVGGRGLQAGSPEGSDTGFERVAAFASGVAYGALCALAIEILVGTGGGSAGNPKKSTAGILGWPGGVWIVGIAGGVMIGVALYQGYRGLTRKFLDDSKVEEMGPEMRKWIGRIGTIGHLARMVVFGLIGIFLIKAASDYNPNKAVGLDALHALGKHVRIVNQDPPPPPFRVFPGVEDIEVAPRVEGNYDAVVVMECSDEGNGSECVERCSRRAWSRDQLETIQSETRPQRRDGVGERCVRTDHE